MPHTMFKYEKLRKIINKFENKKILIVGDIMVDEYIWGKVSRISPEAPVPVVDVTSESLLLGGTANVLNNIYSLKGKPYICGVIGSDQMGKWIVHELRKRNIDYNGLVVENNRPTTIKTRIIAHSQQVVRYDREKKEHPNHNSLNLIIDYIKDKISDIDAIIISDYGKGIITKKLCGHIIDLANQHHKIVAVDPKVNHFSFYENSTIVTPNHKEASIVARVEIENENNLKLIGVKLLHKLNCQAVLITQGEEGMTLFERDSKITHIPAMAQEVYDVTGAGDTVISTLTTALAAGANMKEAAFLSNCAAGIVISKVGTATVTLRELLDYLNDLYEREEKL